MENNEQTFNEALGAVLQTQRRGWKNRVQTEKNGSVVGGGKPPGRADNLIYADEMQPVVVEAAFANTADVDGDAVSRLGREDGKNRREIMTAVALVIPRAVKKIKGGVDGVKKWLEQGGELEYAVYSMVKGKNGELPPLGYDQRYPDGPKNGGYICGTAADLADLIELAATPNKKIREVAQQAGGMVRGIAALMGGEIKSALRKKIAQKVGQPPDVHAMRVAACIWLNALVLHEKLAAEMPDKITAPHDCKNWRETIGAWRRILDIDYKSVFFPALESLELLSVHGDLADDILERLSKQAHDINSLRLVGAADVASDMFPELATDRKETAANYTLPQVAELLAGVAFNLIPKTQKDIKIADFACGTGGLLKAAYRHVRRRAEPRHNLDLLHKHYMENLLHGVDIQPIAAHLTAAGLAGMNPGAVYGRSNIICADVRHGKTGSLDLLKFNALVDLFDGASAEGADKSSVGGFRAADNSFDLCIMNPPYTRNRGGRKLFDVRGLPESERQKSIANMRKMVHNSFGSMPAGMASAFCVLCDRKLKEGGVLAAVLPLTAAGQSSWRKVRARIMQQYSDVMIIGLVPGSSASFSADTEMEEMLICGRKKANGTGGKLTVVNLHQVPRDFIEAHEIARAVRNIENSGELKIGEHVFGVCIKSGQRDGDSWGGVSTQSHEMGFISENLIAGKLIAPGLIRSCVINIPAKKLSEHLNIGPTHHLIGHVSAKDMRDENKIGAFAFREARRGDRTNLSLWAADSRTQIRLVCLPTHCGRVVSGREAEAEKMHKSSSTIFISRGFRMTSQKLAAAMTEKPHMGGRGWTSLQFNDAAVYPSYCLWFNSVLGLIARWQCGGRQHPGRAQMQLGGIKNFPCPEFSGKTAAAQKAVKIANKEFPRLAKLNLMACSYAWRDGGRKKIDAVVLRMLGLDKKFSEEDMQALREEWCREQSVHGGNGEILKALRADGLI